MDIAVTHEIKIGGEKSWVKYGVSGRVQPGETAEEARQRLSDGVNEGVMRTLSETVETVRKVMT